MHASKLPPNPKIGIMTILHQFRDRAARGRPDVDSTTLEIQVSPPNASPVIREKEIIHEIVMIPCKYCGTLMPQTDIVCPNCGAKRTG